MKNILKIAILSMVLINCGNDDNNVVNNDNNNDPTTFEPQNIEFINISKGQYLYYDEGNQEIQNIVFTNSDDWESFLDEIRSVLDYSDEIDFTIYQVIATIDISRPSIGWDIEITDITELENNIEVMIMSTEDESGHLLTIMTQPYHIVKILKTDTDKPINFVVN